MVGVGRSGMRSDDVCKHKDTRRNGKTESLTEDSVCVCVCGGGHRGRA